MTYKKETIKGNRIYFLDNLRTFLVFLVVLSHSGIVYESSGFATYWWIVVDPSIVRLKNNQSGFNVSHRSFEQGINRSYMFALYPNGTTEDVTYQYTNFSNLTIMVVDENKIPITNASINVFSNNHPKKKEIDTEISCTTDYS